MNFKRGFLRIFFGLMFLCFFVTAVPAAEILTEDDFIKKVVVQEDFIKTADNFLILSAFDQRCRSTPALSWVLLGV